MVVAVAGCVEEQGVAMGELAVEVMIRGSSIDDASQYPPRAFMPHNDQHCSVEEWDQAGGLHQHPIKAGDGVFLNAEGQEGETAVAPGAGEVRRKVVLEELCTTDVWNKNK